MPLPRQPIGKGLAPEERCEIKLDKPSKKLPRSEPRSIELDLGSSDDA